MKMAGLNVPQAFQRVHDSFTGWKARVTMLLSAID